jgi:hypothetical protein
LQEGVRKPRPSIKKAKLKEIEQYEFEERPSRKAVEQLLLMIAPLIDISAEEGVIWTKRKAVMTVYKYLPGLRCTI